MSASAVIADGDGDEYAIGCLVNGWEVVLYKDNNKLFADRTPDLKAAKIFLRANYDHGVNLNPEGVDYSSTSELVNAQRVRINQKNYDAISAWDGKKILEFETRLDAKEPFYYAGARPAVLLAVRSWDIIANGHR